MAEEEAKSHMQEIDMRLTNLEQKYMEFEQQMNLASLGITDADRELTKYSELILKLESPEEKLDEQGRIIEQLTAGNSELHLLYESETKDLYQRLNALEGREVIYRDHVNEVAKRGSSAMAELEKNEPLPETNLKLKQELETHQIKINEIQERYQKRINEIQEHLNASDHMKMDGTEQIMKTFAKVRNQQVRNRFLLSEVRSLASGDAPRLISNVKDLNKRLTAFEMQPKISEEHANVEVAVAEGNKVELEEESLLKLNRVDGSSVGEQQRKARQFPTDNEGSFFETEEFYEYLQTLGKTLEYLKHQFATEGHKLQSQVEAPSKYSTFDTSEQRWLFIPAKHKECYLVYLLSEMSGSTSMVFTCTCETTRLLALILRNLGLKVISISGQMSQANKLGALNQFKAGECNILICNDAASRGLDIPSVDIVINYDIPSNSKDYIHWVGRTAHGGAISLVDQYEVHDFFQIEKLIGKILPVILLEEEREKVLLLSKRITEAKISYLTKNKVRGEEMWKPMDMEQCVGGRI